MNRRRSSWRSLSTTRIYQKRKRFYLFSAEEMVNPKTGKAARWHSLCSLEEGEDRARQIAKEIQRYNTVTESGDMPHYLSEYRIALLKGVKLTHLKNPYEFPMFFSTFLPGEGGVSEYWNNVLIFSLERSRLECRNPLILLVGATRFEHATLCSQSRCSGRSAKVTISSAKAAGVMAIKTGSRSNWPNFLLIRFSESGMSSSYGKRLLHQKSAQSVIQVC